MIAGLLSIFGSSAFGTIIGGIFAFMNKKADLEVKKVELAHEKDKWAHELDVKSADLAYAAQELSAKKDIAGIEADGVIESARMNAIAAANQADKITADEIKAAGSLGWVLVIAEAATKFVRPALTGLLAVTAIAINLAIVYHMTSNWSTYTQQMQYDACMQAFAWLTGQAGTVIGYWFVARSSSQPRK